MRARWFLVAPVVAACAEVLGADFDDTRIADPHDATTSEASTDGDTGADQAADGDGDGVGDGDGDAESCSQSGKPPTLVTGTRPDSSYNAFSVDQNWDEVAIPAQNSIWGTAFDGRYVYGAILGEGAALRFDTVTDSWLRHSFPTPSGSRGVVLAGDHVFFVPAGVDADKPVNGMLTRYDRSCAFDEPAAWASHDIGPLGDSAGKVARGFCGGAFDGRYLYLVPFRAGNFVQDTHGTLVRYDTQGEFHATSSYQLVDLVSIVTPGARGYCGGLFDGRYLYLAPQRDGAPALQYDTQAPVDVATSWAEFDLVANGGAHGHLGQVFDGRYVYFVPLRALSFSAYESVVSRYDTQSAGFSDVSSWSFFDVSVLGAQGLSSGVFDGRYVYFSPLDNDLPAIRYDTSHDFTATSSWDAFVPSSVLSSSADIFPSSAFDGRRVMFFALSVARFSVSSIDAMPDLPEYAGSFF